MEYNELKKEKIIVELKELIKDSEKLDDEIEAYCEFMRGVILNTSGLN